MTESGQPSAGVCPPVAEAQLPCASATLPRPPTPKAVKPGECRQAASPGLLVYDAGTAGREGLALRLTLQSGVAGSGDDVSPPGARGAFPPIKGKRSSLLCTAVWHRAFGRTRRPAQPCTSHQHKEGLVPATAAPCAAMTSTLSPSVPQGKVNARAVVLCFERPSVLEIRYIT